MEFIIDKAAEGLCLRDYLRTRLSISARCLSFLKGESGRMTVNGRAKTVRYRLAEGDVLCLRPWEEEDCMPLPDAQRLPFPILAVDEWMIAVCKPYDMPTHQSAGHRGDTLADALAGACDRPFVFRAINRLDRDTSGVVLLARHRLAAGFFASAMARGEMQKTYYAITEHAPQPPSGRMVDYIARADKSIIRRTVVGQGEGDLAITDYETVACRQGRCLLRLMPKTGRTHQLRVQLSSRGMPIVGDDFYGGSLAMPRQALHAATLTFPHPSGGRVTVEAPLPADMNDYFEVGCL